MKIFIIYPLIHSLFLIVSVQTEETTPTPRPLTDPTPTRPPKPSTEIPPNPTLECLMPLEDVGGNLIATCESYLPPDLNFSAIVADNPPDIENRRARRASRPCLTRIERDDFEGNETNPDITWQAMHPKLKFCLKNVATFTQTFNQSCHNAMVRFYSISYRESMSSEQYAQEEGCLGPLLKKGADTVPGCVESWAVLLRRRKRSSYNRDNDGGKSGKGMKRIRARRSKCFYGLFDVLTGGIFSCVKGVVGMASHILKPQCLNIIP